jgi:amidohydrolase
VRTFGGQFYDQAAGLVRDTVQGMASAFGATAEVRYEHRCKPTVNDAGMAELMAEVAGKIVGNAKVKQGVRTMGGEDMSYFLAKVPGAFAFVGSAGARPSSHHSPTFDIEEESLVIGAELLAQTAVRYLDGN